jgi:hypothetical protein
MPVTVRHRAWDTLVEESFVGRNLKKKIVPVSFKIPNNFISNLLLAHSVKNLITTLEATVQKRRSTSRFADQWVL